MIVHLSSRRVVHVNATAHPTDGWVAQQLREATPFGEKSRHLICDSDTKYGPAFHAAAKTCGLDVIHALYEAPRANAICERFVGSLRRECLDQMLVFSNRQLVRVLADYSEYFNQARPHTCTPRPADCGVGCLPVQVLGPGATDARDKAARPGKCDTTATGRGAFLINRAGPRRRPQARCCAGPKWSTS